MSDTTNRPTAENLWRQYDLHVKLLMKYLELVLKFNVFYYAATGALVSFYLSKQEQPLMRYSLLFPIVMSCAFTIVFLFGARRSKVSRDYVAQLARELRFETIPEYYILTMTLGVSGSLFILVAIALLLLFCFAPYNVPVPPVSFRHG